MQEMPDERERENQHQGQNNLVAGGVTLAAMGMVDVMAHLGPPGILAALCAAVVAYRHSGDIKAYVQRFIPSPREREEEREEPRHELADRKERSFMDRALGRYPENRNTTLVFQEDGHDPTTTGQMYVARDRSLSLLLGPNFAPDVNQFLAEGVFATGIKGSGKTGVLALLIEQIARFGVPFVVFDNQGDLQSLVEVIPNGRIADQGHCFSAADIIEGELQVVVNLLDWTRDEERAQVMIQLLSDLIDYTSNQAPEDRKPCPVFMDEAQYWLPEEGCPFYMTKTTYDALMDLFNILLSTGRKRGLTPFVFTQRIAQVAKSVCGLGIQLFMRQVLDVDLKRTMEHVRSDLIDKQGIKALKPGQGVVCMPGGWQLIVSFDRRSSREYASHTPGVDRVGRVKHPTPLREQVATLPPRSSATMPPFHTTQPFVTPQAPPLTEEQQLVLSVWTTQPHLRSNRAISAWLKTQGKNVSDSRVYSAMIVLETRGLIERQKRTAEA